MNKSKIELRVRYAETDQMGVVYHGNYAQYFEVGRVEWLRDKGLSYKKLEDEGVMLPVVSLNMKYLKPAYYDEVLTLYTECKICEGARIEFDYELYNMRGELLTTATSLLVFMNKQNRRPMPVPDYVKATLNLS